MKVLKYRWNRTKEEDDDIKIHLGIASHWEDNWFGKVLGYL